MIARHSVLSFLDALTELGICFMVVFGPWVFGTTQPWAIEVMNVTGYTLGALWGLSWFTRRVTGDYAPVIWPGQRAWHWGKTLDWALALLCLLILGFTLASAWNARATYRPEGWSFIYHDIIPWLPHSYDQATSWRYFSMYLALAFAFWAVRSWLLHDPELTEAPGNSDLAHGLLPPRLRRLLWLLSVNGAVLAMVSIIQRMDGTSELLWLVEARIHKNPLEIFGPFAYRANAAQYFNLIWPVSLGLWWTYQRARTRHQHLDLIHPRIHHLLLSMVLLMAVCPVVSTSRGGAMVMAGLSVMAVAILLLAQWQAGWLRKASVFLILGLTIVMSVLLGWEEIGPRMETLQEGFADREEMFYTGRRMAEDAPFFGTGPGSFNTLFQLYRNSSGEYWPAQLHNDWLETLITFGWPGLFLLLAALGVCLARWFAPGPSGIPADKYFVMLLWCAVGGCLVHARYDFPFQIHSILALFLILCAVLSALFRRG
ncbi:MAG: O-antigen ligase family protein [Verrucomicrobiota bacterium]